MNLGQLGYVECQRSSDEIEEILSRQKALWDRRNLLCARFGIKVLRTKVLRRVATDRGLTDLIEVLDLQRAVHGEYVAACERERKGRSL